MIAVKWLCRHSDSEAEHTGLVSVLMLIKERGIRVRLKQNEFYNIYKLPVKSTNIFSPELQEV
jgi:hypothetical protein